jgi:preprotein translocase subunit SecG
MEWLETTVIVVHILVSLGLIGLVMIQQGKGAEAGASFGGGASQTVFGSQGSGSFLTRMTAYLAVIFFVTSVSLAVIAKQKAEVASSEESILAPAEMVNSSGSSEEVTEVLELEAPAKDAAVELE